ncbi:MAG: M48 family metalloprotease [Burkholderiales bacterium]
MKHHWSHFSTCAMGWCLFLVLVWTPAQAQNNPQALSYEPVGLAWTATEVERASLSTLHSLTQRATAQEQMGCQRYCKRLNRIFQRLLPHARAQSLASLRRDWSLTVVRLPGVDAMALPGGQIIISENFIAQHRLSDEAIAFVLAHEMAHSILEHERQVLTFARMLLPREVHRTVKDMYTEMEFNRSLLRAVEPVMQQGEFEADELGLLLAASAGFSPDKQITFIAHEAAREIPAKHLMTTHPTAQQRLEKLRERLPLARRLVRS